MYVNTVNIKIVQTLVTFWKRQLIELFSKMKAFIVLVAIFTLISGCPQIFEPECSIGEKSCPSGSDSAGCPLPSTCRSNEEACPAPEIPACPVIVQTPCIAPNVPCTDVLDPITGCPMQGLCIPPGQSCPMRIREDCPNIVETPCIAPNIPCSDVFDPNTGCPMPGTCIPPDQGCPM